MGKHDDEILSRLRHSNRWGPPPDDFEDDGCTMSPDGWFRPACRIHDWHYFNIRKLDQSSADHWTEQLVADACLKVNIRIMSSVYVDVAGFVQRYRWWNWRFVAGKYVGPIYFKALRLVGFWSARAKRRKG